MVDPFEQFKYEMEPVPNPFMDALPALGKLAARLKSRQKPPKDVVEKLKAVSADEDDETVRRVKKVNEAIEDWKADE